MKKIRQFFKKLIIFMLVFSMILPTTFTRPQTVQASALEGAITGRINSALLNSCSRVFFMGVSKVTSGLDSDSVFGKLSYIVLGTKTDETKAICKEILSEVQEVNANLKSTKEYLSGLISDLKLDIDQTNLSNCTSGMNDAISKTNTVWNYYASYLESIQTYEDYPTVSNLEDMQSKCDLLYTELASMDFSDQMSKYIGYVCRKLVHSGGTGEDNKSYTYLDYLYKVCKEKYAFDYQIYDALCEGISMNVLTIQKMMELHAVYISKLKLDYEQGNSSLTEKEYNEKILSYQECMNTGINACNDIAEQYYDEMRYMVRSYDKDVEYELDYKYSGNETVNFNVTPSKSDTVWSLDYPTKASKTSAIMNFYRVSVDGKTYLFLNQSDNELTASDMIQEYEGMYKDISCSPIKFTGKSRDWLNLRSTKDGNYKCITDVSQVYDMISTELYNSCGNDFLKYVQNGGGLTSVAGTKSGNPTSYLFLDSTTDASVRLIEDLLFPMYGGLFTNKVKPTIYMKGNWSDVTKMSLSNGGFSGSYMSSRDDYQTVTDENVLVMLKAVDDATFNYQLNQKVDGHGSMEVVVNDSKISSGDKVEACSEIAITVKPDKDQTLDSLSIQGKEKTTGESLYVELALDGDFEYMQKNKDGSVTYYFTMPYQDCTIKANFVKDIKSEYSVSTEFIGTGSCRYRIIDEDYNPIISFTGSKCSASGVATFGERLKLEICPDDGSYIKSIALYDEAGNFIMNLSALSDTYFTVPEKNCILKIDISKIQGLGTIDDPYLIATYSDLIKYKSYTWNGSSEYDAEHYQNSYYKVTADINCDKSDTSPFSGFIIGENGVFDGQGYDIFYPSTYYGLFYSIAEGGIVKNVVLDSVNLCRTKEAAGLAYKNSGTIENCEIKAVRNASCFKFDSWARPGEGLGGLVYENTETGVIRNSGVKAGVKIQGKYVGGIAYTNNGVIENCYFSGEIVITDGTYYCIISDEFSAAGIFNNGKGTADNCYTSGSLDVSKYNGDASNIGKWSGEIVCKDAYTGSNITNCYYNSDALGFTGSVTGNGITAKTSEEMSMPIFGSILNSRWDLGYKKWIISSDVNAGYPAFEPFDWYYITEDVTGSGSITTSRESNNAIAYGVAQGEKINIDISKIKNVNLKSLKVCKKSDRSVVYKDFTGITDDSVSFEMPNYDVIILAEFTNLSTEYTIGKRVDGVGELFITNEVGEEITSESVGNTVSVKAVPGVGYTLAGFELRDRDGNTIETFLTPEATFEMDNDDCVVYVKCVKGDVTYSISAKEIGTGKGKVSICYRDDTWVKGNAKAYTDIILKCVTDDESYPSLIQVTGDDGSEVYTRAITYEDYLKNINDNYVYEAGFCMPAMDCKVTVTYDSIPKTYNVDFEVNRLGKNSLGEVTVNKQSGMYYADKATEGTELGIYVYSRYENTYVKSVKVYDSEGNEIATLTKESDYEPNYNEEKYVYKTEAKDVKIVVEFV